MKMPRSSTLTAAMRLPQRLSLRLSADEKIPIANNDAAVPSPNAAMVNAPASAVPVAIDFKSAA